MRALRRKFRGESNSLIVEEPPDDLIERNRSLLLETAALAQRCERAEREVSAVRREAESVRDQNVALEAQLAEAIDRIAELEVNSNNHNHLLLSRERHQQSASQNDVQQQQQQQQEPPQQQEQNEVNEFRCCITLEPFEPGDEVLRLPCLHVHHTKCLVPYLKRQTEPECPICRTPVPVDDIDNLPVWNWQPPSSSNA